MHPRFWEFARPYLGVYTVGLALLLVTNGLALWIPWLLRDVVEALEQGTGLEVVARLAVTIAVVALAQAGVRTLSRLAILGNSRKIVFDVRNLFFRRLQRLDARYFATHRTGDIMSRGINDIQLLQSFYGPGVMNLLNTGIVYVATLVLLLSIDVQLTLVSLAIYPVLFFGVNRLSRRVYARSIAVQEQLAAISNRAQENISGIQQVKTYVQEEREISAFRELCAEFRRRNLAMATIRGAMLSLIGIVAGAGTLVVLFVGGRFVAGGRIGFGDFVAFNAYLGALAWPTIAMGWIVNVFQRSAGAMERLDEVLQAEPDVPAADQVIDDAPIEGDIEIRGLTFHYEGDGETARERRPALRDVNLTIPANSRVALVGPVGSGKSTLAGLLARIHSAPCGTIFIGGRDVTLLPVRTYRESVGFVPQEAFLFSRSIRDNIVLADPEASDERVQAALRVSHLARDLERFPEGENTIVGERGFTLSGGQRQRATLARAVLRRPRLLILDDSLSSVDADTEQAILEELGAVMAGRTTVLISHRLSAMAAMDRIVVMDQGSIVEQGSHAELLALGGLYARLVRRQRLEEGLEQR